MNPQEGAFIQDASRPPDPCLTQQLSILRFVVLALLFVTIPGGAILLALVEDRPFGIQFSSMVMYTAGVALYTFSRNRNNNQPFLVSCPVVRRQLSRLVRRHVGFLSALVIVQTKALEIRPSLPTKWITPSSKDASPFAISLGVFGLMLAIVQILTNRSLLDRAHRSAQANTSE
jgi:hypothetical protein